MVVNGEQVEGGKRTHLEDFKNVFYEKYYPLSFHDAIRNEFLGLIQGSWY